jgi:hypothetical protein
VNDVQKTITPRSNLRVIPAVEAGIADHVWSIEEIVGLLTPSQEEAA